jgi:CPA2 family monovalent cation:H+ antiporter-2
MGGQLLARALRDLKVPYLIMELNGRTVRTERAAGESIFYGDAANPDALEAAGVGRALAVVGVLSDPLATSRMISTVRALSPSVPVIVRTRYVLEAERMTAQGASVAVAEELEASLEVLAQMLARLHMPGNVIEVLLEGFRDTSQSARRIRAPRSTLDALPTEIMKTPVATHQIQEGHWVIGRTIADADLRATTGALILAVRQNHRHIASPPADLQLAAGDVLYLVGDESDILLARDRLDRGTA